MVSANTKKRSRSAVADEGCDREMQAPAVKKSAASSPHAAVPFYVASGCMAAMGSDAWSLVFSRCDAADLFRLVMTGDTNARSRVAISADVLHNVPYHLARRYNTLSAFPSVREMTVVETSETSSAARFSDPFAWPTKRPLTRLTCLTHTVDESLNAEHSVADFSQLLRNAPNLKHFHTDAPFCSGEPGLNGICAGKAMRSTIRSLGKAMEHLSVPNASCFDIETNLKWIVTNLPSLRCLNIAVPPWYTDKAILDVISPLLCHGPG